MSRLGEIADPSKARNPEYAEGLRAAVSAAIDYGLSIIEHGDEDLPIPPALLVQAHLERSTARQVGLAARRAARSTGSALPSRGSAPPARAASA